MVRGSSCPLAHGDHAVVQDRGDIVGIEKCALPGEHPEECFDFVPRDLGAPQRGAQWSKGVGGEDRVDLFGVQSAAAQQQQPTGCARRPT